MIQSSTQATRLQSPPFHELDDHTRDAFIASVRLLPPGEPITILIDSPGGSAKCAYQLASFLRKHCGGFKVIIPDYAKSAATLLVLGADEIVMSKHAELGPLDVQIFDYEREDYSSALNEVQALERLNAFALQAVDAGMMLLGGRSGKSVATLLPLMQNFVANMLRPLFEKIDTVHYTQMSRSLKVAEEYAVRLLKRKFPKEYAEEMARHLVHDYPDHGFYIDHAEAATFGLKTILPTGKLENAIEEMVRNLQGVVAIGKLEEVTT
jgi:hypothetical protein